MKKFKMPDAFTILIILIALMAVMTWIIPAGQYERIENNGVSEPVSGSYAPAERAGQGLGDVLLAPFSGLYDAIDIAAFILMVGAFLGVMNKTGALEAGIFNILRIMDGREKWMIPILMTLFALGGTTFGMAEETIAFYALIIPVFIAAGYDSVTGAAVILTGAGAGVLGSTVNPFATGIAAGFAGISMGEGMLLRIVIFLASLIISIIFVMRYAERVRKNPQLSLVYDMYESNRRHFAVAGAKAETEAQAPAETAGTEAGTTHEDSAKNSDAADTSSGKDVSETAGSVTKIDGSETGNGAVQLTTRRKTALVLFAVTFAVMIYSVIPFEDMGIHILPTLGWWFPELSALFLTMAVITGIVYGLKENEIIRGITDGAADLLGVAFIIGISRGITVIMNDGMITDTILHYGEMLLSGAGSIIFILIDYLVFIPLSFLIPSTSGLATLSMPVLAPLADFAGVSRALVITAFQSASGLVNMVTPTSAVVMGGLAIGRIPYERWLKFIWKYLLILFIICGILIAAAAVI